MIITCDHVLSSEGYILKVTTIYHSFFSGFTQAVGHANCW